MAEAIAKRVIVIGAGPGGYAAAFRAADNGLDVTLVDVEANPGGVCLHRGCVPLKALLNCAKILHDARRAAQWGIAFAEPSINFARMHASKDEIVARLAADLGQLLTDRGITLIQGRANFEDSNTIKIVAQDGSERVLQADATIIASGARPAGIPGVYLESPRLLNTTTAIQFGGIPGTMLVAGGGYLGLELASVYAALGTKVTIVESSPAILPAADEDLVRVFAEHAQDSFHEIWTSTKVTALKDVASGIEAEFEDAAAKKTRAVFEQVLLSVGRNPNSSGLGLKSTRVETDDRGFIKIDTRCRTADPAIWAVGDVSGEPLFAHKASHQGRVAADVIAGRDAAFEPRAIPAVVFTNPEIAWCGLTERQAASLDRRVTVARFPWGSSDRAALLQRTDGLTKVITDPDTDRVLGMGICGPGAGELIAEGVLAIEMGAVAADIGLSLHAHPTLSETLMQTADLIFSQDSHRHRSGQD